MAKQSAEYKKLSKHLTKLASKANHRYDRMEKSGWKSPAMETVKNTGGRFHNGRTMSYREMQKEHKRVNNFLNSKTSTKRGTKQTVTKMLKATGLSKKFKTDNVMKNKATLDKYFKVYKKMSEYQQVQGIGQSYQSIMNAVTSTFESVGSASSVDDLLDKVAQSLTIPKNDWWNSDETFKHIIG